MTLIEEWRLVLKRAASIKLAGVVVVLASAQAALQAMAQIDLSSLPIATETAGYIQMTLATATALAGVGVIIARLLQQASISGGGNGKS